MITETISQVDSVLALLRKRNTVNVNDGPTKKKAIEIARDYFASTRPILVAHFGESEAVLSHDGLWQQLVRLAHGNNSRKTYLTVVPRIRKDLTEFNVAALSAVGRRESARDGGALTREEELLLATLDSLVPSAATSYRQGLIDLRADNRLSFRGTAAEFRESLREVLDHLAPDDDVVKKPGFKLENGRTLPTMKQKVRFVLSSRGRNKTQMESAQKSAAFIDELSGEVTRAVYDRAALATHIHQSREEVQQIKRYVDTVLFDLLEVSG